MINSSNIVLYNYMYMEIIKDRLLDLAVQKYKVMSVSSQWVFWHLNLNLFVNKHLYDHTKM